MASVPDSFGPFCSRSENVILDSTFSAKYRSEEVLAQPVEASLTPESYGKAQQWMKVAIKTMQKGSINRLANLHEVEQPCRDGSTVWTETSVVYLMDDHNHLFEIIGVSRDIGERKRLNDEIHKALVSEKDSNRTMNRLMRVVAHEFRTPLSLLSSSIDLIDHYWERLSIKQRREQIGNTRSSLHQMSSLINSIVSFINLDHQNSEHKPTLLDIERTCNTLAAEVGIVWGTEHDFHITISPDCGAVFMQEVPFRRVLSNLLTNAFRYTPSGGTISLHVSRSDKRLLIILEDTGIGIPEKDQQLIFGAFYRCNNAEYQRGMGLGLSIVQEALATLEGTILVESHIGKGTTMRVELPCFNQQNGGNI